MEKDRDQLTPDEPEDWAKLQRARGQGTGGPATTACRARRRRRSSPATPPPTTRRRERLRHARIPRGLWRDPAGGREDAGGAQRRRGRRRGGVGRADPDRRRRHVAKAAGWVRTA